MVPENIAPARQHTLEKKLDSCLVLSMIGAAAFTIAGYKINSFSLEYNRPEGVVLAIAIVSAAYFATARLCLRAYLLSRPECQYKTLRRFAYWPQPK